MSTTAPPVNRAKTPPAYDVYSDKLVPSNHKWMFANKEGQRYWGYLLPYRTSETDSEGRHFVKNGEFWTPFRADELYDWMDKQEPTVRRCLRPDGFAQYYAGIRSFREQTGKQGPGVYTEAAADQLDMQAENWRRQLKIKPGASVDRIARHMTHTTTGCWDLLDLIMRGIISTPDEYIVPPIIKKTIEGVYKW